jgi:hypothetical protein
VRQEVWGLAIASGARVATPGRQDQDEQPSEEPMKSCATPRKLPDIGARRAHTPSG